MRLSNIQAIDEGNRFFRNVGKNHNTCWRLGMKLSDIESVHGRGRLLGNVDCWKWNSLTLKVWTEKKRFFRNIGNELEDMIWNKMFWHWSWKSRQKVLSKRRKPGIVVMTRMIKHWLISRLVLEWLHAKFIVEEMELEYDFPQASPLSPPKHHSTIAPYLSVTALWPRTTVSHFWPGTLLVTEQGSWVLNEALRAKYEHYK